jgi:hypothetical protein
LSFRRSERPAAQKRGQDEKLDEELAGAARWSKTRWFSARGKALCAAAIYQRGGPPASAAARSLLLQRKKVVKMTPLLRVIHHPIRTRRGLAEITAGVGGA